MLQAGGVMSNGLKPRERELPHMEAAPDDPVTAEVTPVFAASRPGDANPPPVAYPVTPPITRLAN
jgi:hypothetical protein